MNREIQRVVDAAARGRGVIIPSAAEGNIVGSLEPLAGRDAHYLTDPWSPESE
jgi:hypothetical protein